jgi:hypothetical protein
MLTHKNINTRVDKSLHSDALSWIRVNQFLLLHINAACLEEKQQIPMLLSFGLTRPVLELIIYHTWGEHDNYFTTDRLVVMYNWIKAVANNCQ